MEGTEEMGTDVEDPGNGRGKKEDVRNFFKGCGPGGYSLWVRDMGADPLNGTDAGRGSVECGSPSNRKVITKSPVQRFRIHPPPWSKR